MTQIPATPLQPISAPKVITNKGRLAQLADQNGRSLTRSLKQRLAVQTATPTDPSGWTSTGRNRWSAAGLQVEVSGSSLTLREVPAMIREEHHNLIQNLIEALHIGCTDLEPEHVPLLGPHFSVIEPGKRTVYSRAFLRLLGVDLPGVSPKGDWARYFFPVGLGELLDVANHIDPEQDFPVSLMYHGSGLVRMPDFDGTSLSRSYWIDVDFTGIYGANVLPDHIEELFVLYWPDLTPEDQALYAAAAQNVDLTQVTVPWVRTVLERILAS